MFLGVTIWGLCNKHRMFKALDLKFEELIMFSRSPGSVDFEASATMRMASAWRMHLLVQRE